MTPRFPAVDTDPHPVFSVYSAGNFGEVAPQRISPMSWSLVGTPMERATRRLVERSWGGRSWANGSHYVFLGYFACRPYHNLSAYVQLARQLPLVAPEDVTAAYFEGVRPPRLGDGGRRGPVRRAAALPRLIRELTRLGPSLVRLEEQVADLEQLARTAVSLHSEAGLTEVLTRAAAVLDDAWDAHIVSTTGLVPLTAVQRRVYNAVAPHAAAVTPWLNRPEELVWDRLHLFRGDLAPGEFLGTSFYEVADDQKPWSGFAVRPKATGAPAAAGDPFVDPAEAARGMLGSRRRYLVDALARTLTETMMAREHSKSLVMRMLHVHRRILPLLADTWSVDGAHWPYLTIEEFRRVYRESRLIRRVPDRMSQCARAVRSEMPEHLDLSGGAGRRWATDSPSRPQGVSPGQMTGAVVRPPLEELPKEYPAILVCESADADVAPLLPLVSGVVTGRGSGFSHIAILAREHRIPAVVGYGGAGALRPGDVITIDGTTGQVRAEPTLT